MGAMLVWTGIVGGLLVIGDLLATSAAGVSRTEAAALLRDAVERHEKKKADAVKAAFEREEERLSTAREAELAELVLALNIERQAQGLARLTPEDYLGTLGVDERMKLVEALRLFHEARENGAPATLETSTARVYDFLCRHKGGRSR